MERPELETIASIKNCRDLAVFFSWISEFDDSKIMRIWKRDYIHKSEHHFVKKFNECDRNGVYFFRRLDIINQSLLINIWIKLLKDKKMKLNKLYNERTTTN